MSDLTEQLRAVIEQTEWIAEHAVTDSYDSHWREKGGNQIGVFTRRDHVVATFPIIGPIRHVIRHDPAAVLLRCAADRKLLDAYEEIKAQHDRDEEESGVRGYLYGVEAAVKLLAEGYGIEVPA